jgi:hypothetical protein
MVRGLTRGLSFLLLLLRRLNLFTPCGFVDAAGTDNDADDADAPDADLGDDGRGDMAGECSMIGESI